MKRIKIILAALASVALSGCITNLDVSKANKTTNGIKYFLPQVFIQVTPNKDGTVTVEKIYLPDPNNEYAIQASSFLGSYTIDVNRTKEGFLETVSFNSDSTGVAKQLMQTEANLKATEIDAQAAKSKAADTESKASDDKKAASIAAAEKIQKDTQLAVDVSQRKLDLLVEIKGQPNPPSNINEQIISAKLAVAEAVVRRDTALVAYNSTVSNFAAANAAGGNDYPKAPEPAFFQIVMSEDYVKLEQVFIEQQDRLTWNVPKTETPTSDLLVLPSRLVVWPNEKKRAITATVKSDQTLVDAKFKEMRDATHNVIGAPYPIFSLSPDRVTVDIHLPPTTLSGDYEIDGLFITGTSDKQKQNTRTFSVQIRK